MPFVDLEPSTLAMSRLLRGIPDELLDQPTPCDDTTLGDLIDHVGGLSLAFTAAATKTLDGSVSQTPSADASRLGDDWRTRIPADLAALAGAGQVVLGVGREQACAEAGAVADQNGARLQSCELRQHEGQPWPRVLVSVRREVANTPWALTARAAAGGTTLRLVEQEEVR